ncbi:MAG TPA: hypothetical protein VMN60_09975 [Longimicrobiales bacterium]|nr:hypothetical protein [Longimicrobiales bacterium]
MTCRFTTPRTNEGTVTVLPSVDVRLSNVRVVTDEQGQTGLSMQVTNVQFDRTDCVRLDGGSPCPMP